MAPKEALKMEEPQDAVETQDAEGSRERSTIGFPYQDLDEAVTVAKGVHAVGGTACQWDQLAAHFQQSANGGGFRLRVLTAKMFGLLNYERGTVTLTPLGTRICDSQQEASGRVDAFLTIPLYKAVYEQFKGATLPPTSGLRTAMVNLGVSQKQKDKARQVFQRSAQEAGFFTYGTDRLVMPSLKASATASAATPAEEAEKPEKDKDADEEKYHPFIQGLLKKLPTPETDWPIEGRAKWLQTAANIFDLMYTDSDDSKRSISIACQKDSAK